ncbi:MAG: hypothetical protein JXR96_02240 [Deltaproteobacteria bacterium]|nr:hypothetical protein [Deltaproteobacteria bacterium]
MSPLSRSALPALACLTVLLACTDSLAGGVPRREGFGWDIQLEGGYAVAGDKVWGDLSFFGRARLGALFVGEPWYLAVGPVVTAGGLAEIGGGLQVELTHLYNGLWGQLGLECNDQPRLQVHIAAGFSIGGLEWQQSIHDAGTWALIVKLRIPIGIAVFGFTH